MTSRLGRIWYWLSASRKEKRLPPPWLRDVGPGDFETVGREFVGLLQRFGGLTPSSHILDVGCGSGRLALALTDFLAADGRYVGVDIVRDSIAWCRREVSTAFPNFEFHHVDVANSRYNPRGRVPASRARFPAEDATFDLVALISVFTHMLPGDQSHYLEEASRVLRPSGRLFATYFLHDDARPAPSPMIDFSHPRDGHWVRDENQPEGAVATDEPVVLGQLRHAGLVLVSPIRYGYWRGEQAPGAGETFQDIVIAQH